MSDFNQPADDSADRGPSAPAFESILIIRASKLAGELGRIRQRGIGNLDLKSHNQSPVSAEKTTLLAKYYSDSLSLQLHGRDALIGRLIWATIREFGQRGNEYEARFLRDLFFGSDEETATLRPGKTPGELLRNSTFAVMLRRGPRLAGLPGFLRLWLVGGMVGEIGRR